MLRVGGSASKEALMDGSQEEPLTSQKVQTDRFLQSQKVVNDFMRQRTQQFCKAMDEDTGFVSLATCVAYGAPDFAKAPIALLISVHLIGFYQKLGVDLGSMVFFMALARCIDVLSDPVMANITDATRTRWGRRRPFMFVGAFCYGTAFFCLCSPPEGVSPTAWFGVFYIVFFLTDTLAHVPHNALGQEVTTNAEQRRKLFLVAKLFEGFGTLLAAVLPALLTMAMRPGCGLPAECSSADKGAEVCAGILDQTSCTVAEFCSWVTPSTEPPSPSMCESTCLDLKSVCDNQLQRLSFMTCGAIFGGWSFIALLGCVFTIREKDMSCKNVKSDTATDPSKLEEVLPGFFSMMKNKPFRAMLLPWVLDSTLAALLAAMLPFFVKYVIIPERLCIERTPLLPETSFLCSDMNVLAMDLVGLLLAAILSMPFWFACARRWGDYNTWIAFNGLNAITNVLLILPNHNWGNRTALIVCTVAFSVLNGLPIGAKFLTDNVLGVCIDYDELRNGIRSEASFTMFASFIPKVVSVPASTLPLSILAFMDFKRPSEDGAPDLYQSGKVIWSIRAMFAIGPFLLALASCILKWRLFPFKNLEKVDSAIKTGMQRRSERKPYLDPLDDSWVRPAEQPPSPSWRRAIALLNHFSGPEVIEQTVREVLARRGTFLLAKARRQLAVVCLATAVFLGGAIACCVCGLLSNQRWSWVPSLMVLATGVGLLFVLLCGLRLRAARELLKLELRDELLDFLVRERSRVAGSAISPDDREEADELCQAFVEARSENGVLTRAVLRRQVRREFQARESLGTLGASAGRPQSARVSGD